MNDLPAGAGLPQCLIDARAFLDDDRAFVAILVDGDGVTTIASRARRRDVRHVKGCAGYVNGSYPLKAQLVFLLSGIQSVARNLRVGT